MNTELWQALPDADMLEDGGSGLRFEVQGLPAFAVKHHGQVHAYLNQCAHVAMEMDWQAGQFFDFDAQYLMCATHGALYEPSTGLCVAGPCVGKQLKPIALQYYDHTLYASRQL
jgi:nitrite reductase/ring-hydroxylating ferredoxin subunit